MSMATVGTNTTNVTCGYYPLSIGYYTPSNRISIIWTNAAQDLQIWDSAGNQFTPYTFGSYGPGSTMVAMGGGYEGTLMSLIYIASNQTAFGLELDRSFNQVGQQTLWQTTEWWLDSAYELPWSSAGFLIEGRTTDMTGTPHKGTGVVKSVRRKAFNYLRPLLLFGVVVSHHGVYFYMQGQSSSPSTGH
jgi:hypothetical protein